MGILCVFCVYDTIGNRCFEKTSFPIKEKLSYVLNTFENIMENGAFALLEQMLHLTYYFHLTYFFL